MPVCSECGKTLATAGGLEIHMELAHKADAELQTPPPEVAAAARPATPPSVDVVALEAPRRSSPPTGAALLALAIVALLVAGVASALVRRNDTGPATPLALVRASASTTADAKTTQFSVTLTGGSGAFANGFTEQGGFDFDNHRATVAVDPAQFGAAGIGKLNAVVDFANGFVEYLHLPPQVTNEAGGKPWIKIDLNALLQKAGLDVNIGSLLRGQSNDPTQGLSMVRGAENVVKVGTDVIRGTETTHYHLDVNFQKAVAEAPTPEARAAMQQLVNLYTVPSRPLDVWLDADGRVRRTQYTQDFSIVRFPPALAGKVSQLGHPIITTEYYGFGSPVDATIPPADQVTDLNDLLRQGR